MAREVDIWWVGRGRQKLKASMRWTNKRGRITFFLIPAMVSKCTRCPFKGNPICSKWKKVTDNKVNNRGYLCSMLWRMKGNNNFEERDNFTGWQPLGPLGREKKKE